MARKTNAVFETAKRIAEKERLARVSSIRWSDDILLRLAAIKPELDRLAVFTEDKLYDPDRVVNLMQAQSDLSGLIDTLSLVCSPATIDKATALAKGGPTDGKKGT
jgi:hypothetical protein